MLHIAGLILTVSFAIVDSNTDDGIIYKGQNLSTWVSRLAAKDNNVRKEAIAIIVGIGEPALPAVGGALRSKDPWTRFSACMIIEQWGGRASQAVPDLKASLHDELPNIGQRAALALAKLPPQGVLVLAEALKDKDPTVRLHAASALGSAAGAAKTFVPALTDVLRDEKASVRGAAAWSLGNVGDASESVIVALTAAVKDSDPKVRYNSVYALRQLGGRAGAALPALCDALLKDSDHHVRVVAASAISKIAPKNAEGRAAIEKALQEDKNPWVRGCICDLLGTLGSAARESIPALEKALQDSSDDVRRSAANAITEIHKAK